MGALMDLVAGKANEILVAVSLDDWQGLADRTRFAAHLSLGGGLDPTWLDLFSEACRSVTGSSEPYDFLDARRDLGWSKDTGERTVERVDMHWIEAVARLPDHDLDRVAGRWIDLLDEEYGTLPREEKPWIRTLAADVVSFARDALRAPDVLFAWSL